MFTIREYFGVFVAHIHAPLFDSIAIRRFKRPVVLGPPPSLMGRCNPPRPGMWVAIFILNLGVPSLTRSY